MADKVVEIIKTSGLTIDTQNLPGKTAEADVPAYLPAHSIGQHKDVLLTNPGAQNVLWYDTTLQKWVNTIAPWITIAAAEAQFYPISNPAGYLTSETDPVFSAHAAAGVTAQKIINWDDAHGWGNHATAGYVVAAGKAGGQTVNGGTASGENLTLQSTAHATKGSIFFGTQSRYEQITRNLQLGRVTAHQIGIELYSDNNGLSFGQYPTIAINNPNAAGYAMFSLHRGDGVNNMMSRWVLSPSNDVDFGTYTNGGNLNLLTKNIQRVRIKGTNGFVGVGITDPQFMLHVGGDILVGNYPNSTNVIRWANVTNSSNSAYIGQTGVGFEINTGSTGALIFSIPAGNDTMYLAMRANGVNYFKMNRNGDFIFGNGTPVAQKTGYSVAGYTRRTTYNPTTDTDAQLKDFLCTLAADLIEKRIGVTA